MKTKLVLSLLIAISLCSLCFGQKIHWHMKPIDSLSSVKKASFSSTEAGFSIDLPKEIGGFSGVTGIEYNWRLNEGYYVAGIVDKESDVENSSEFEAETLKLIDQTYAPFARELFASSPNVVSAEKKEIEFQGHKGIQARITLTDTVCLIRVFWVKNRAFKTGVLLTKEQQKFESQAQTVFNSLKVFEKENTEEIFRRKIEENTPKPLPQTPVVKKLKSDAEDEGLKGKVKSVFKEDQFIKGAKAGTPKQKDSDEYYNEAGNLTKKVLYSDTNGFPFDVTVYGYINGSRVSKSNFIEYESSIGGIMVEESPSVSKRRDNRYDSKYVYKYDIKGNLIERINYDNAGRIWNRLVYKRNGNVIDTILYDEKGQVNNRTQIKIDDKGNEIENVNFDSPMEGWTSTYSYKYEDFDKEGNWIKRTMTKSRTFQGATKEEWVMIEYRTIFYY
jgi:hypothetical protein